MVQDVYVISLDPDAGLVTVGCGSVQCESCKASLFCNSKTQRFEVRNPQAIKVAPGDRIRIYMPPGKTILSSIILFAVPLILFPVFYLLFPSESQIARAVAGLFGGALGFLAAYVYFKRRRLSLMPVIQSRIEKPVE